MPLEFERSFASHEKAKYWSSKNDKKPEEVYIKTGKKFWFDCDKCGHEFEKSLDSVSRNTWCKYCYHNICTNNDCQYCFQKSFASHDRAKCWSNKNKISPRYITLNSNKPFIFDCDNCGHEFISKLNNIYNGKWCPYCCIHSRTLCNNIECMYCFKRSFASHEKAQYWSIKNTNKPRDIMLNHNTKVIMNCNKCNYEFKTTPSHIMNGCWCPKCINKTELKLYNWLKDKYTDKQIILQKTFDWCKSLSSNKKLRFDFEIDEKVLIELDGPQHFRQISNWESPEAIRERDKFKITCALKNNRHIIHINQVDIFKDINNWDIQLENIINELINEAEPTLKTIGINKEWYN